MATRNDISGMFVALRAIAAEAAGADLPPAEKQAIQTLAEGTLRLLEWLLIDVNRAADALEQIAARLEHMNNG